MPHFHEAREVPGDGLESCLERGEVSSSISAPSRYAQREAACMPRSLSDSVRG